MLSIQLKTLLSNEIIMKYTKKIKVHPDFIGSKEGKNFPSCCNLDRNLGVGIR